MPQRKILILKHLRSEKYIYFYFVSGVVRLFNLEYKFYNHLHFEFVKNRDEALSQLKLEK